MKALIVWTSLMIGMIATLRAPWIFHEEQKEELHEHFQGKVHVTQQKHLKREICQDSLVVEKHGHFTTKYKITIDRPEL